MLNGYFAFGVPLFLIIIYLLFAVIRRRSSIHYLGFILLIISAFMTAFSFQVLQEFWSSKGQSGFSLPYNSNLLWLPLFIGAALSLINIGRGLKRFSSFRSSENKKN